MDSEEKILRDFNRIFEPHPLEKNIPSMRIGKPYEPVTDFEAMYQRLRKYARVHGKPERVAPKVVREAQSASQRESVRRSNKDIMSLWIRLKKLHKDRKSN